MEEFYNFKESEPRISRLWDEGNYFTPRAESARRTYSMFLNPPNASGPMHVGNALMIAIQDVLARYHRAKGDATLWIPSIDHGGYETQVTYERERKAINAQEAPTQKELYASIAGFVEKNNKTIVGQIKAMGASVDWSRFRYTLDEHALTYVYRMFRKMLQDNLLYRSSYMVNYCTSCATVLADIELKERDVTIPRYFVRFTIKGEDAVLSLATTQPEFLFSITHVLVHPKDEQYAKYIGTVLVNPVTGADVLVVESKRKYDPEHAESFLSVFAPSYIKYDFEYAIRHRIPVKDLFDWQGALVERYPGLLPAQAQQKEIAFLEQQNALERVDTTYTDTELICKKGHVAQNIIRMTWFLRLDDERVPLRTPALEAFKKEGLVIQPRWREKGLLDWLGKMHDWPIARQNVWGIKIPVWYDVSDPSLCNVWFIDVQGTRRYGNLKEFLQEGIPLDEIAAGLERIYAAEGCQWALEREDGKMYLPETDTFDTWFSSGAWGSMIFDDAALPGITHFYPSNVMVIGYDLLRLAVAREIILGQYMHGKLPFRRVYFHSLLKSADGQKMSKSLGNAITLDQYLERYGADVTRMALVSYTDLREDFVLSNEKLEFFQTFASRLWQLGKVAETANTYPVGPYDPTLATTDDKILLSGVSELALAVGSSIEKYLLAQAQEKLVAFIVRLEEYASEMHAREDVEQSVAVFHKVFKDYVTLMHPFAPFITEELFSLYTGSQPLAALRRSTRN